MSNYAKRAEDLASILNPTDAARVFAILAVAEAIYHAAAPQKVVMSTPAEPTDSTSYDAYLVRERLAASGVEQDIVGERG